MMLVWEESVYAHECVFSSSSCPRACARATDKAQGRANQNPAERRVGRLVGTTTRGQCRKVAATVVTQERGACERHPGAIFGVIDHVSFKYPSRDNQGDDSDRK